MGWKVTKGRLQEDCIALESDLLCTWTSLAMFQGGDEKKRPQHYSLWFEVKEIFWGWVRSVWLGQVREGNGTGGQSETEMRVWVDSGGDGSSSESLRQWIL